MGEKFNHLNVPSHWEHYWTKYPEGYTILEALLNWVAQVDKMVDNVNEWNEYLDDFVATFDENLQGKVVSTLSEWQDSGFLDVVIDEALQTQMDVLEQETHEKLNQFSADLAQTETDLQNRGIDVSRHGVTPENPDNRNALVELIDKVPDGATLFFPPGRYVFKGTVYIEGKSIHFRGNDVLFIKDFDGLIFDIRGGYENIKSVADVDEDEIFIDTNGFKQGDIVRIVSDDQIPHLLAGTRSGEYAVIRDVLSDRVRITKNKLFENYSTNIRMGKLKDVTFSMIGDFKFDTTREMGGYIRLRALHAPIIEGVKCLRGYSAFIILYGCFRWHINNIVVKDLENNPSAGHHGYGVLDQSGEGGLLENSTFINNRHGYTTGQRNVDPNSTELEYYGQPMNTTIKKCYSYGGSAVGFDTHSAGVNIMFVECEVNASFAGADSSGGAYQSRSYGTKFIDCIAYNCNNTFRIDNPFIDVNGINLIEGAKTYNCNFSVDVAGQSEAIVRDSEFDVEGFRLADIKGQVWFENVRFHYKADGSYRYLFDITDSETDGKFVFINIIIDLRESSASNIRLFRVASPNAKVTAENIRIINTADGQVDRLFENENGILLTKNISFDTPQSEMAGRRGNPINRTIPEGQTINDMRPYFIGEEVFDAVNKNWYKAVGYNVGEFKLITPTTE